MEGELTLTRLWAIISPYLAKFMKDKKLNATFVHELVIIFSAIYLSKATFVISSFNLRTELQKLLPDVMIIPWIYRPT